MNRSLLVVVLLLASSFAWWDFSWKYRRQIAIDKDPSNSTVMLKIDTSSLVANNKTKTDCSDLRVILNDKVELPYFYENCNTSHTLVWFKTQENGSFYLYYGNPGASDKSSSAAFQFLDTLESYSVNSSGSPTWVHRLGSWRIGTAAESSKNLLAFEINNSASPGIAYANQSIGRINYTVHGRLMDRYGASNNPHPGVLISYANDSWLDAVYFRSTENTVVWYKKRAGSVQYVVIGSYTLNLNEWYSVDAKVYNDTAYAYVNGDYVGNATGVHNGGFSGMFMHSSSSDENGWWDNLGFYYMVNLTVSVGSESQRPETAIQYIGTESATMRTLTMLYEGGWDSVRKYIRVRAGEKPEESGFLSNGTAVLEWGTLSYNQSGYAINGSWRWLFADHLETRDGPLRARLIYKKSMGDHVFYHIVNVFRNYSAIKHVVIAYSTSSGNTDYALQVDGSSVSYSWNGTVTYGGSDIKHVPTEEVNIGDAKFCGIKWVTGNPAKMIWKYSGTAGQQQKKVFWESYGLPCDPFGKEIEVLCNYELQNCTARSYSPLSTLISYSGVPGPLGKFYTDNPAVSCYLNGQTLGDLFNTSALTNLTNILKCDADSDQTINTLRLSVQYPYTATQFFGEKPEVIKASFEGGIGGGALEISKYGVPVFGGIIPFRQDGNLLSFRYGFPEGKNKLYVFLLKNEWSWPGTIDVMDNIAADIDKLAVPVLRFFSNQEFPVSSVPRTSAISSARALVYSNESFAEVRVSIWKVA